MQFCSLWESIKGQRCVFIFQKIQLWRLNLSNPGCPGTNFGGICANLHWIDTSLLSADQKKERAKEDGCWLVSTWLKSLAVNFATYFQCGKENGCIFSLKAATDVAATIQINPRSGISKLFASTTRQLDICITFTCPRGFRSPAGRDFCDSLSYSKVN